jgi:polygalacturonase
MNPSILILISTLLLCSCGGDSSPAHGYAGSSAHVAKSLDPVDYGAVRDGTTDDQAAIQSAIDAAIASGADVELAGGTFVIGSPLVLSGKTTLWLHGKLKLAPGFTGSEAISITGDHVSLMGNGVLDFNGAAIEQGISAVAATRIQRPRISGLRFANFNPSFTASDAKGVIAFQFCDQPDVNGVYMSNCGGAGIYWSNCRRGYIYNTVIDAPGFLGITLGACMDCRVSGCTVTDAGQFCFKSGFGTTSHAISSDEAPAALAITVAADAASRRQFLPGQPPSTTPRS